MGGLWHPNLEFTGLGLCHLDLCQRGTPSDIASPTVQGKMLRISKGPQSGDTRDLVGGISLRAKEGKYFFGNLNTTLSKYKSPVVNYPLKKTN